MILTVVFWAPEGLLLDIYALSTSDGIVIVNCISVNLLDNFCDTVVLELLRERKTHG